MRHGARGEYSESFRNSRIDGSVTLELCGVGGSPAAESNSDVSAAGGAGVVPLERRGAGAPGRIELCADENDDECTSPAEQVPR